jgi:hypothetical protein
MAYSGLIRNANATTTRYSFSGSLKHIRALWSALRPETLDPGFRRGDAQELPQISTDFSLTSRIIETAIQ